MARSPPNWLGVEMCEECRRLDDRIAHYQYLLRAIIDRQTVDTIEDLIWKLEAQKKALHPAD
jgi:hypothetical protein